MTKTSNPLKKLQYAIHGVTAPFFCEGSFVPEKPAALVFKDKTEVQVRHAEKIFEQENDLAPLLQRLKPAPFGEGKKTSYNRHVRDAFQLKAENGAFAVAHFDPESAGILREIQKELMPQDPHPISAELYTVNVYCQNGHFAPHKDTPRGDDMFGTLVVCLPSRFSNGNLVLSHQGIVKDIDWAWAMEESKNPDEIHWAAFFGDVDHQIERVWSGARVTLTYLLRRAAKGSRTKPVQSKDLAPGILEAWQALLADESFLPDGGTIGYPCGHLYHQDARLQKEDCAISLDSGSLLKGRDHFVASSALEAGLEVTFSPYMFEDCADETWQLDRFPTNEEKRKLRRQMDEDNLKKNLPIYASSEVEGDFGITWL